MDDLSHKRGPALNSFLIIVLMSSPFHDYDLSKLLESHYKYL